MTGASKVPVTSRNRTITYFLPKRPCRKRKTTACFVGSTEHLSLFCREGGAFLWCLKERAPKTNLTKLTRFFEGLASLPFDDHAAERYGQIRTDLAKQGQLIGPNDLLIAAIALAHQVTLVSNNRREFSRVADLQLVDWLDS
ncbi:MAG: type II toxin-antitoxin system VapC family toxin [Anaerolineales bacterium]|nr:type II toxin-antitoxin system VapC family toxin [Anaerolineales bacterium]